MHIIGCEGKKKMPISFTDWHSIVLYIFVFEVTGGLATFADNRQPQLR